MRAISLVVLVMAVGCCNSKSDPTPLSSPGASNAESKSAPAAAQDNLVDVDLKPIPLSIRVPKGGMGAMDMTIGDKKSVTVDIGEGSLNVQEMAEKDLAQLKTGFKSDKILFPFKKFAKEEGNMFVVEFEPEGKKAPGYIGVTMKELGGKKYVCKTTGLEGVKSAADAEKQLKACDTLHAK